MTQRHYDEEETVGISQTSLRDMRSEEQLADNNLGNAASSSVSHEGSLTHITKPSVHHHMHIRWNELFSSPDDTKLCDLTFCERAALVGHVGMMLLSFGTGAWRVRDSMNTLARNLNMTCSADIGLVSLDYTCIDADGHSYTQDLSLATTGVNTTKLHRMENLIYHLDGHCASFTLEETLEELDAITSMKALYSPLQVALASGLACGGFIFLLGGGLFEVVCCFFGAGFGNYVRRKLIDKKMTLVAQVGCAVASACVVFVLAHTILSGIFPSDANHLAGYIGALLFVIPGFPFITAGLDLAQLDMRSGIERLIYAIMIIIIATTVGWTVALCLNLQPHDFVPLVGLTPVALTLLRLFASWCGVFGFSIMFNTDTKMAALAGVIGALANTLRLSMVSWTSVPPCIAAFLGTLLAGLLASVVRHKIGFPRIALTVPSIVIMVPGLYMYRSMYAFASLSVDIGSLWLIQTILMVLCLPMGLIVARMISDPKWRHIG